MRLESEAVIRILDIIDAGVWEQVSSRMAAIEAMAIPDQDRRQKVLLLLPAVRLEFKTEIMARARQLVRLRLKAADAVHVAAAEDASANAFLTCDDRLLRSCLRIAEVLRVRVANPLDWLLEQSDGKNLR